MLLLSAVTSIPAHADDTTSALAQASKLIDQGQPVKAIEVINQTLKGEKVPSELTAKGLLMRAKAQEKLGKFAYALADYNSALWIQGLSSRDKTEAEQGRERIMNKLGVSGGVDSTASVQPTPAEKAKPVPQKVAAKPQQTTARDTIVQTAPSEEKASSQENKSGIGSFFSNLFGSSSPKQQATPVEAQAEPERKQAAAQPTERARPQPVKAVAVAVTAPPRVQPRQPEIIVDAVQTSGNPNGDFAIQMAALESEDKAISEVNRISRRFGELLGGRKPSIKIKATSDGGTLYKVVAEPYQRGEGAAICELLKTKGVACMIISK